MGWPWGKKRGDGGAKGGDPGSDAPPRRPAAPEDDAVSGRRDFFRLGFGRAKEGGIDALRAVAKASRAMQDALDGVEEEVTAEALDAERERQRLLRSEELERTRAARPARAFRGVVRPPGAVDEAHFLSLCDGCRKCIEACPEGAIVASVEALRSGKEGTPLLRVQSIPCALCPDVPCASACPTGALEPVGRGADIRIGLATVFRSLCINSHGEDCEICVDHCPLGAAVMTRGEDGFPVVNAETCTGCGQCVVRCPTYPAALHVTPR